MLILVVGLTGVLVLVSQSGTGQEEQGHITVVKAPEQTEAKEHPDFKVEEYVPQLPEGTNIAVEGKVKASSFADVYLANKSIDGKAEGTSYWEAAPDTYPNILTLDLKVLSKISAIRVCLNPSTAWGDRTQTFSVSISKDGEQYEEIVPSADYAFSPQRGNEAILEFDEKECQYVQLQFTGNTGAKGAQVAELEVYSR